MDTSSDSSVILRFRRRNSVLLVLCHLHKMRGTCSPIFDRENVDFRFSSRDLSSSRAIWYLRIFLFISGQIVIVKENWSCNYFIFYTILSSLIYFLYNIIANYLFFIHYMLETILYNIAKNLLMQQSIDRWSVITLYIFSNNHALRHRQPAFARIRCGVFTMWMDAKSDGTMYPDT